jgi:hypothetical protein
MLGGGRRIGLFHQIITFEIQKAGIYNRGFVEQKCGLSLEVDIYPDIIEQSWACCNPNPERSPAK